ncbi:SMI1/KNR4 family protein [Pigmentiphaga sp.]|uniref:SMI1/KNR4 family protein n=1 Tax=Pigmentiphaga sp. TaxID=1977564 RepID=UPI00343429E8
MRNLVELNLTDRGRRVELVPPSDAIILAFENEFNVKFPPEYIEFLMYSNGGHPELDSISPMGRTDVAMRSVDHFYYLNDDEKGVEGLWFTARAWSSVLGKKEYL